MLFNPNRLLVNTLVLFLSLVVNLTVKDLTAQVQIDGPQDTACWVFHESGRIFAASKSSGSVIEYDTQGKEVRKFDVGIFPTAMIIKGNRLVVACSGPGRCSVIDLDTNEVTGEVRLKSVGPRALFCSKVDNGIVYAVCFTGNSRFPSAVFQVDIENFKVLNFDSKMVWGQNPYHVAMSANGKWIVTTGKRNSKGSATAKIKQFDEATTTRTTTGSLESNGKISAGPLSRYWMVGDKLYSSDFKWPLRQFSGNPVAIHSQLDLAVSISRGELKFFRFSNAELIKQVPFSFPEVKVAKNPSTNSESLKNDSVDDVQIGFGFKGESQTVFIASRGTCQVFDLKKVGIPLEPMLLLVTPEHAVATVDKEISVPLKVTNQSLSDKTVYEIKRGAKGAHISGDKLIWTPTEKCIGRHTVVIAVEANGLTDETSIEFEVQSKRIELNFNVAGMAVDQKGQHAVVWGNNEYEDRLRSASPDEVSVIDLATEKVLIQKTFTTGVQSAVFQGPYLYLLTKPGNIIQRLDPKSLTSNKRIFLQKEGRAVFAYPGGHVAYTTREKLAVIDSETLKQVRKPIRYSFRSNYTPTLVSSETVALDSSIVDRNDGALLMLTESSDLPTLGKSSPTRKSGPTMFGRQVKGFEILSSGGAVIANTRNRRLYVGPYDHVAFGIRQESKKFGSDYKIKLTLDTLSLVDGAVLDTQVFESTSKSKKLSIKGTAFVACKDKVVYALNNKVYVMPLDRKLVEAAPEPLHFLVSKLPILSIDDPQTIDLKVSGGKGELAYQLIAELDGLSIDSKTGVVTVDTPVLWKNFMEASFNDRSYTRYSRSATTSETNNNEQIEELLGEPLPAGEFALTVPIHVKVTDDEAQEDLMSAFAIVIGDRTALDEFAAKKKAEAEAEKEARYLALREDWTDKYKDVKIPLKEIEALGGGTNKKLTPAMVARNYKESVVLIRSGYSSGTGFIVGKSGYVMTCAHCISDPKKLKISLIQEDVKPITYKAKLLFVNAEQDIALLKIDSPHIFQPVKLGVGDSVEMGMQVTVIGNPGVGSITLDHTMTEGIVSSTRRIIGGVEHIQTSAAVNPGNSGGPMFDQYGNVTGMVSLKANIEGAGFAVPANTLAEFLFRHQTQEQSDAQISRTWHYDEDNRSFIGTLMAFKDGKVRIRQKSDERELELDVKELSEIDQTFLQLFDKHQP